MPDDQSIRALLERRRWEQAFEALVAGYQSKVFRLAYSILGNRAAAEDAAQESFLRVWRAIETYNGTAAVSTWLYAITRNTALSLREYHARRTMTPLEHIAEPWAALAPPHPEQELWDLVAELPDHYRQVIMLFHMEEKSYEEVSHMLALPLGTVKTHLYRARKLLGAKIEEQQV
ncbi:MAG: RNA polymerase sigma factor [Bryobacterales bacterium]|nr:RNA polymerase sigma factor [Bryobacterales bacterium]